MAANFATGGSFSGMPGNGSEGSAGFLPADAEAGLEDLRPIEAGILEDFDRMIGDLSPTTLEAHGRVARDQSAARFRDPNTGGDALLIRDFNPVFQGDHYRETVEQLKVDDEVVAERPPNGSDGGWTFVIPDARHLRGLKDFLDMTRERAIRYREVGSGVVWHAQPETNGHAASNGNGSNGNNHKGNGHSSGGQGGGGGGGGGGIHETAA